MMELTSVALLIEVEKRVIGKKNWDIQTHLFKTQHIYQTLRRLDGQQDTHQIFLKFLDKICLAMHYHHEQIGVWVEQYLNL